MDVPDLDYAMQVSQERLIAAWQPLRQAHVAALLQQVKDYSDAHQAGDATWIEQLQLEPADAGALINGVEAAIVEGRETALDEARKQDEALAARVAATDLPHHHERTHAYATGAERLLARSLIQTAARESFRLCASTDEWDTESAVAAVLGDTSTRYERDILQGMATGGVNEGRYHVMAAILNQPAGGLLQAAEAEKLSIYALEILDGNTCDPCAAIDGQEFATLAEARALYPGVGGGYIGCDGRERCRGSIIIVYPEAASFGDQPAQLPPKVSGGAHPDETPVPLPAAVIDPKSLPSVESLSTWNVTTSEISAELNYSFAIKKLAEFYKDPNHQSPVTLGLDAYTGTGYSLMNRLLRGSDLTGFYPEEIARATANNQSLIDLFKSHGTKLHDDVVLYRGASMDLSTSPLGRVIEDAGFMSTSWDASRAAGFMVEGSPAGLENVLLRIHVRSGKTFLPGDADDMEILLQPGARYVVVKDSGTFHDPAISLPQFDVILLKPGEGVLEAVAEFKLPAGVVTPKTWQVPSVERAAGVDALRKGEEFKNLLRTGSVEEREAMRALDHYMNYGHTAINAVFRNSIPVAEMDAGAVAEAKALLHAFQTPGMTSAFAEDQLLYRGLMMEPTFGVGSTLTDHAVVSTSINPRGAAEFARPKKGKAPDGKVPVILRLHTPEGTRFLTGNDFEGEAILQPGTRYVVVRESQPELQIAGGKYTPPGVKTYDAIALPPEPVGTPGVAPVAPKLPATIDHPSRVYHPAAVKANTAAKRRLNKAERDVFASRPANPWDDPIVRGRSTLVGYAGSNYRDMNKRLRGVSPLETSEKHADEQNANLIGLFRSEAASETKEPMLLHRGQSIDEGSDPVNSVLSDAGFMSTSVNVSTAQSFLTYSSRAGREKVMLRIHVQPGARYLPANAGENELLFPPNTEVFVIRQAGTIRSQGKAVRVFDALLDPKSTHAGVVEAEPLGVSVVAKPAAAAEKKAWKGGSDASTEVQIFDPDKVGGKEFSAARVRSLFQSPTLTDLGLHVDVALSKVGDKTMIRARIKDAEGQQVGEIARLWDGSDRIDHITWEFDASLAGQGVSKELLKSSQELYYKLGIKEARTLAYGQGGKYAWARYGFDFAEPEVMQPMMRSAFRQKLLQEITGQLLIETNGATKKILQTVVDDPSQLARYFPKSSKLIDAAQHSWEFAGLSLSERGITLAGNQVMKTGPDWQGVLDLRANTPGKKVFLAYTK